MLGAVVILLHVVAFASCVGGAVVILLHHVVVFASCVWVEGKDAVEWFRGRDQTTGLAYMFAHSFPLFSAVSSGLCLRFA